MVTSPTTGREIRCPATARYQDDLVGCGSSNVIGPDEDDGTYDCLDCGLFFTEESIDTIPEADRARLEQEGRLNETRVPLD